MKFSAILNTYPIYEQILMTLSEECIELSSEGLNYLRYTWVKNPVREFVGKLHWHVQLLTEDVLEVLK